MGIGDLVQQTAESRHTGKQQTISDMQMIHSTQTADRLQIDCRQVSYLGVGNLEQQRALVVVLVFLLDHLITRPTNLHLEEKQEQLSHRVLSTRHKCFEFFWKDLSQRAALSQCDFKTRMEMGGKHGKNIHRARRDK